MEATFPLLSIKRLRSIQKYQTPVVGVEYVNSCLEKGVLLPVDEYKLDISSPSVFSPPLPPSSPRRSPISHQVSKVPSSNTEREETSGKSRNILEKFRIYTETDTTLPKYPDNFQVAKYSIFEKINSRTWCVLELQSYRGETGCRYRVVRYWKDDIGAKEAAVRDMLVHLSTSEEALEVYKILRETLQAEGLQLRNNTPPQAPDLGSDPLQLLLLEEKLNTGSLSQEVGVFVELLWTEALGCLGNILTVPINKLSLNDVSRVEGLLLQAQRKLKESDYNEVASLIDEVYTLLPHKEPRPFLPTAKFISQKLDLCQLIRDVLNVSEMTLRSPTPSCLGKYRALRCCIEAAPPDTPELQAVTSLLQERKMQVKQVLRVSRGVELQTFKSEFGNVRPLLHSSSPSNFVGVLSRGLLPPRVGVEHHGIERTDAGNLGSGIYFSDDLSASLKYSKPSETDGSRLLLVCDVALGQGMDVHKKDLTLTEAPEGYDSVHGVRRTPNTHSEFVDDEYVVYSPDQVKLKFVVQYSAEGDAPKEFSPNIDICAEPSTDRDEKITKKPDNDEEFMSDETYFCTNPLDDVKAGLMDSSGQQLPLQAVHVKCKLMDLLSQVIIFQKYTNLSSVPIEAKYVFPLEDSAAVCGFEAFINGKHVVGQVKEKETARREYKQAIKKGHGAYLMDQDAPDVFTISVGNLPPNATVLIKVTFVSELVVTDGSISFHLPGSVAPWQESAALYQTTQVTVEKVCVKDEAREFTLDMAIEMPNEITELRCISHKVKIKKTDCKAVLSVLPGEVMGPSGFMLSVTLSEVHLPRMWVEKHPDKDSQASMLVFYPDFEVNSERESDELVLLLDTSESMKGESFILAQKIALKVLRQIDNNTKLNVIVFGTDHKDAFLTARPLFEAQPAAETFIKLSPPVGGSTELWRPLRALSLLPPSRGVRNLLLLSDGHIQNAELTLQLLRDNAEHSRLFACGLSPTANRHMLRALAQAGGGAFEFFNTKTKHNWTDKVASQLHRMASPSCSSVSVKWQQFNPTAPPPVQAPKQLHALFNDCHTLVYGFVPHCTQATLLGSLSGQELQTMVSTSELQKTRGTFLHKLTARALIRDYEDGSLDTNEAEHEGKKAELKRFIIELSKEFSILSQFTSFVAVEERDSEQPEEGFTDIPKLLAEEDVDFLPYMGWIPPQDSGEENFEDYGREVKFSCYVSCDAFEDAMDDSKDAKDESEDAKVESEEESEEEPEPLVRLISAPRMYTKHGASRGRSPREAVSRSASSAARERSPYDPGELHSVSECSFPPPPAPPPPFHMKKLAHTSPFRAPLPQISGLPSRSFHRHGLIGAGHGILNGATPAATDSNVFMSVSEHYYEDILNGSNAISDQAMESLGGHAFKNRALSPSYQTLSFSGLWDAERSAPLSFLSRPTSLVDMDVHAGASDFDITTACATGSPVMGQSGGLSRSAASLFSSAPRQRASLSLRGRALQEEPVKQDQPMKDAPPGLLDEASDVDVVRHMRKSMGRALAKPQEGEPLCGSSWGGLVHVKERAHQSPSFHSRKQMAAEVPRPLGVMYGATRAATDSDVMMMMMNDRAPEPSLKENPLPYSAVSLQRRCTFQGSPALPPPAGKAFSRPRIGRSIQRECQSASRDPPALIGSALIGSALIGSALIGSALPLAQSALGTVVLPDQLSAQMKSQALKFRVLSPSYQAGMSSGLWSAPLSSLRRPTSLVDMDVHAGASDFDITTACATGSPVMGQSGGLSRRAASLFASAPRHKASLFSDEQEMSGFELGGCALQEEPVKQDQPMKDAPPFPLRRHSKSSRKCQSTVRRFQRKSAYPEALKLRWTEMFQMQHSEGYWQFTTELGELINLDVDLFANVFLKNKGIQSLGVKAHADILKLVATLLVLQLMREEKIEEGKLLRTLFCLDDSPLRPERWEEVKRAVDWVCWADRQYPCVYSRLEFGFSWESSTRQLLGFEGLPPFSALRGLNLQKTVPQVLVH
ncbi:protein mono-ADP-ribosyltransferase PARP4 isoform X2 [Pseudochaenichthys georgianus]|uniref:protein mono-ADP-ribosyltransferase PARP4 isoform X2 n=1 Tax=Pseudochaenichthys georgianus TaxID=52239 RepID=UPI00146D4065|nr:protein mono-ADP-ribosyltransferase PARP4 isoform X2 [Pseudochaenichthys georgianus]